MSKLFTATLLTRRPLITAPLTSFERAYYDYQHELRNSHAREFSKTFWSKKTGVSSIEIAESAPRETDADRNGDMTSLNRKLDVHLFLITKQTGAWMLPTSEVQTGEPLHEAAKRGIHADCGPDMDLWFVGRAPIGHVVDGDQRTYIHKAHILAGKPRSPKNEYKWVTKQEMKDFVLPDAYRNVVDLL